MRLVLSFAILSTLLAGGCRQSDEKVKAELRTQMMQRCTTDTAPQAAQVPGFDAAQFCTCVTDKAIGDRSVAALKKMFEDKAATAEQGRQAGEECLAQQMPAGVPAQAAAPTANLAPSSRNAAAPAAPAEAGVEKAGNTAEADEDASEDNVEDSQ